MMEMINIIKLTNKYYRKKYPINYRIFVKYQQLKRSFRLKTKKIIPLSKKEECLYNSKFELTDRVEKVKKGKYFKLNGDIHILNAIPKTDLDSLYIGLNELIIRNPVKHLLVGFLSEKDVRDSVFLFSKSSNSNSYSRSFFITPDSKELKKLIEFIEITLFELSDDYIGICFEVNLTKAMKTELNNLINGECHGEEEFVRHYRKKKKLVSIINWNPNITREKKVNDYIIEIKCRVLRFLDKYLPLTNYSNKAPISIDIYSTNYDLKKDEEYDSFLHSYDIFKHRAKKINQMTTVYRYKNKSDEFVKSDFLYICGEGQSEINRSAKLIINKPIENQRMFLDNHDIINFYIITLYFYYLGDFERTLTEIRNNLYNYYNNKESKIYKGYEQVLKKIQKFKMMFNNISLSDMSYTDDRLQESLKFQNDRYCRLIKKYDDLELSFNNKMLVSNYKSTLFLTKLSILLSILAIVITLYLSYRDEKNTINNKIENSINKQTLTIEQQTSILNNIMETLK